MFLKNNNINFDLQSHGKSFGTSFLHIFLLSLVGLFIYISLKVTYLMSLISGVYLFFLYSIADIDSFIPLYLGLLVAFVLYIFVVNWISLKILCLFVEPIKLNIKLHIIYLSITIVIIHFINRLIPYFLYESDGIPVLKLFWIDLLTVIIGLFIICFFTIKYIKKRRK